MKTQYYKESDVIGMREVIIVIVKDEKQLLFTIDEKYLKLVLKTYNFKEYDKVIILKGNLKLIWKRSTKKCVKK